MSDDTSTDIERLQQRLGEAREAYDKGNNSGRVGALMAIMAVNDFLLEIGVSQELSGPIFEVATALQDLENGKQNPMLVKSDAAKTKPPETITDGQVKAMAAAGMELLMRSGVGKEAAANQVFYAMIKWNHSPKAEPKDYKTIQAWRDRIKWGDRSVDADTATYYAVLDTVKKHTSGLPDEAEFILNKAIDSVLKGGIAWAPPTPKKNRVIPS